MEIDVQGMNFVTLFFYFFYFFVISGMTTEIFTILYIT